VAGERTNVGASLSGDRGREVEDELIGGDGGTERERVGEGGGENGADSFGPRGSEREGARVGADRRDPPIIHRGCAGAGAHAARLIGLAWAEMAFSFFPRISIAFSIYFL
jgi:hypothetical protein